MNGINLEPLDDAIAWAEREQAGQHIDGDPVWRQAYWLNLTGECGTACCIAGRIALDAGYVPVEVGPFGNVFQMRHPDTGHEGDPASIAYRIVLGRWSGSRYSEPYEVMGDLAYSGNDLDDIRICRDTLARLAESGW